jgi:hypothetical protein
MTTIKLATSNQGTAHFSAAAIGVAIVETPTLIVRTSLGA